MRAKLDGGKNRCRRHRQIAISTSRWSSCNSDEIELFMKISKASFDALNSSWLYICFHQVSSLGDEKEKKNSQNTLEIHYAREWNDAKFATNTEIHTRKNNEKRKRSVAWNWEVPLQQQPLTLNITSSCMQNDVNDMSRQFEQRHDPHRAKHENERKEWKNQEREISKNLENQTHWMKIYSFLSQTQISRQHVVVTHKPATYGANRQLRLSLRGAGRNEWRRKPTKNAHSYHFLPIDGKQQRQKRIVFIYFFLSVFFLLFPSAIKFRSFIELESFPTASRRESTEERWWQNITYSQKHTSMMLKLRVLHIVLSLVLSFFASNFSLVSLYFCENLLFLFFPYSPLSLPSCEYMCCDRVWPPPFIHPHSHTI